IGQNIERLQTSYDAATNKLITGKGNIVRRVEKLKQLGAKASKDLPERYRLGDNTVADDDSPDET
ncbi:MAG: DNA recombination protein RmuC, partial [Bacteroidales bacterium]|nr:DNA recombination protein RmuC [Bacteroidales bacterium]